MKTEMEIKTNKHDPLTPKKCCSWMRRIQGTLALRPIMVVKPATPKDSIKQSGMPFAAPSAPGSLSMGVATGTAYHLGMSRIRPEYLDADASHRWLAADVLLCEEPNEEEEDEEEDEGNGKQDDNGDDNDDDGYSLGLPLHAFKQLP